VALHAISLCVYEGSARHVRTLTWMKREYCMPVNPHVQALHHEGLLGAMKAHVCDRMGSSFVDCIPWTLPEVLADSNPASPLIFILAQVSGAASGSWCALCFAGSCWHVSLLTAD